MVSQTHIPPRAWGALLLLGAIWGGVFIAMRIALDELTVLQSVAHRVFWAACAMWLYVGLRRLKMPRAPGIWAAFLVMGLLNNVLPFALISWGQLHIESGLAAIFNAATAIFGVLAAAVFFADERLTTRKLAGVLIGFGGVVVAIGIDNLTRLDIRSLAQLAVLGATMCYALAGIWARKRLGHLPPPVATTGMLSASALVLVPLAWIIDGPIPLALAPTTMLAIAFAALVATALAYLLYWYILGLAGSGNLMLVTLLVPPVAITLGAVMRGESLPPQALIGFGFLALGLVVLDGRALGVLRRRQSN